MRLLVVQFCGEGLGLNEAVFELQKKGHEIVYWVVSEDIKNKERFSKTIFHNHLEALVAKPALGVDVGKFIPPSLDLLRQLSFYESRILTMMNKKLEYLNLDERKRLYFELVGYWDNVFEKYKFEAVVFPVAPHTVYDYVIYSLAKLRGVKTIMFDFTRIGDRLLTMNNIEEGNLSLRAEMSKNKNVSWEIKDLHTDIAEHYQAYQNLGNYAWPADVVGLFKKFGGWNWLIIKSRVIFANILNFKIYGIATGRIKRIFTGDLRKEYLKLQVKPDLAKKFVYVPLHYQPESSTSSLGDVFVDQILMIETLAVALPKDWVIYVKEHPTQWLIRGPVYFGYRYRGYYEKIAKLPNVFLIPISTDSFTLIDKSQALATVTGSAGWEAVLRDKPALVFGYPWYRDCPGVFMVNNTEAVRFVLDLACKGSGGINQNNILHYLVNFGKFSVKGYVEDYNKSISKLTPRENALNLSKAIHEQLS